MALEAALEALGSDQGTNLRSVGAMRSAVRDLSPETPNKSDLAAIDSELARPNLHPIARAALQGERQKIASGIAAPSQAEAPLSSALQALSENATSPQDAKLPATSMADQIPGMPPRPVQVASKEGFADKYITGPLEAATAVGTGMIAAPIANVLGVAKAWTNGKFGSQESANAGEDRAAEIMRSLTYAPRTESGKEILGKVGDVMDATKLSGMGPAEGMALGGAMGGAKALPLARLTPETKIADVVRLPGARASVGASGLTPNELARATVANSSPELKAATERALQKGPIHQTVLERYAEGESLPVPIKLSEGQATQDVTKLSIEQNRRGKDPISAARFNEQNQHLIDNVNAIKEQAAPDVYATTAPAHGDSLIEAYRTKDAALNTDISAKYQALKDANGGQFPLDSKAFVEAADTALHKELLFDHVSAADRKLLDRLRDGGTMTFENFESLRTNLARTMRSPTADGNVKAAAGVIRDALEALPMPPGAEHLKPIADIARSAARERFALIEKDPAYKAVVNGSASADKFAEKYIVNGDLKNVETMRENLAHDPVAQQTMASATMNYLKQRAGIIDNNGNFSQAGYNKALEKVRPKLDALFEPAQKQQIETLGNVARYTQAQPRGSFVNNSNTLTGMMAEGAKSTLEGAANVAAKGIPIGTWARKVLGNRSEQKAVNQMWQTGAGIQLKNIK